MKMSSDFIAKIILKISCLMMLSIDGEASLRVGHTPTTIIRDESSLIDRPEGITFSPSGDYIAAANSLNDTITFYKRIGIKGAAYENIPAFLINGIESKLDYPHDVAFSPDGSHFAVANRYGNSITIYKKNEINGDYDVVPIATIQGEASYVMNPDSVRYSPIDNVIAVVNTWENSITFYRYEGDVYENEPYQIIQDSKDVLLIPDSLDFSPDGKLLAITSHDTHSVLIYQRLLGSNGLYTSTPTQIIKGPQTNFCYPHSVSFHPNNNYLVVSSSQGRKNINIFKKRSKNNFRYHSTPILSLEITQMYEESTIYLLEQLTQEGGCKGISFSPDGTALAVTQNLAADLLKLPFSVGVLLIYSTELDE